MRARSWPLAGIVAAIAVVQASAWWYSARAAAGTPGTLRFWRHASWTPPLGWAPWIMATAAGTLALLAFAALEVLGDMRRGPVEDGEPEHKHTGHDSQRHQQSEAS